MARKPESEKPAPPPWQPDKLAGPFGKWWSRAHSASRAEKPLPNTGPTPASLFPPDEEERAPEEGRAEGPSEAEFKAQLEKMDRVSGDQSVGGTRKTHTVSAEELSAQLKQVPMRGEDAWEELLTPVTAKGGNLPEGLADDHELPEETDEATGARKQTPPGAAGKVPK